LTTQELVVVPKPALDADMLNVTTRLDPQFQADVLASFDWNDLTKDEILERAMEELR
jgi:hypothetical protein